MKFICEELAVEELALKVREAKEKIALRKPSYIIMDDINSYTDPEARKKMQAWFDLAIDNQGKILT